ncbi:tpr domain protein [Apiospora aurea]|uniref:Tpr domain protein n=1 Tax=Apiospora aurea TaxID=335848 RepID=A0ABR1PSX8_9PEZI
MSEAVRARPAVSQQFGSAMVSDGSRLFQGIVQRDLHLNQHPERPETPPKPTAVIPFNRDTDFIQRDTILDQLHRVCSEPASRTALVGLGGVGKSQIAIEYTYRVRDRSPETWVFWIHASSAARYEQSFRDIADHLKLPGRRSPQTNIFQLLYVWLRGEKSGKWVLILDNVDEAGFLLHNPASNGDGQQHRSDGRSQPLVSYLPTCQHGSILITTRSRDVASKLAESRNTITVDPMNQAEAITLAKEKLGKPDRQGDIEAIESLVYTLEYMPLAIVQATAYISQRAPRCSVRQYLEKFTQSDRKRASLLDYEAGQLRRDGEAKNSIIITRQISFDHIRQTRPSAANLLSLMSFCDRQGIPESLLRASDEKEGTTNRPAQYRRSPALDDLGNDQESSDEDVESDSSIDDEFETDVSSLRDYSFISAVEDGKTFEMHSLVQLATKRWLEAEGQQEKWKSEFIHRLDVQLPTGAYEN